MAKVDIVVLVITLSAIFGPSILSPFFSHDFNSKLVWPSGIVFLVTGIPYTIMYSLYGWSEYTQMDIMGKVVWIKRFGFGLILIVMGCILLGFFTK